MSRAKYISKDVKNWKVPSCKPCGGLACGGEVILARYAKSGHCLAEIIKRGDILEARVRTIDGYGILRSYKVKSEFFAKVLIDLYLAKMGYLFEDGIGA